MKAVAKIISLLICISLCACACGKDGKTASDGTERTSESTELVTESGLCSSADTDGLPSGEKYTVSYLASREDFLSFEPSSYEREFPIEMVVIHFTSAVVLDREDPYNMDTIRDIFENNKIGINYIIGRDGSILCWLPEERAPRHAGLGKIEWDPKYTDILSKYSIGIEIAAMGSRSDMSQYLHGYEYDAIDGSLKGYTDAQYESLRLLLRDICERNGIPYDRKHIIGHEEYSPQKTDPGELFDWSRLSLEK